MKYIYRDYTESTPNERVFIIPQFEGWTVIETSTQVSDTCVITSSQGVEYEGECTQYLEGDSRIVTNELRKIYRLISVLWQL